MANPPPRAKRDPTTGVLCLNVGTPASPSVSDVRRYLRQFLSDPRILDMNPVGRWLLLNLIILPFRPRRSAAAYREIWTPDGSPLLVHSESFRRGLQDRLGPGFRVVLGMAYGQPSIADALATLRAEGIDRIVLFPQFPQYASATTGSVLAAAYREAANSAWDVPSLSVVPPYFDDPVLIAAYAAAARPTLTDMAPDHVLLSFHGLPERHVERSDHTGSHCLASADCCDTLGAANRGCYRAQCFATGRALAAALKLPEGGWSVAFQSRMGRIPWIGPHTDERLRTLAADGVRRLAVLTPAFVTDCLETLEEIGMRAREDFRAAGGEDLRLVPCLNDHPDWIEAAGRLVERRA